MVSGQSLEQQAEALPVSTCHSQGAVPLASTGQTGGAAEDCDSAVLSTAMEYPGLSTAMVYPGLPKDIQVISTTLQH